MKTGLWVLIIAVTSWSIDGDFLASVAMADGVSTSTLTGTSTDTNCSTGGTQYGGGQWNWCNRSDPAQQKNTQNDTKDLNNSGAQQSTMLGMAAIAAGMAMVAAGMAMLGDPATAPAGIALIAAGMALIASGMAALAAASKMNNNANTAAGNAGNLDNFNPYLSNTSTSVATSTSITSSSNISSDVSPGSTSGIKIDPALTRTGKLDTIFNDMEAHTGLSRDAMLDAVGSGANPLDVLANSPALSGKPSSSSANLQKMMDDTMSKGNLPSGQDVMDKLGLTAADLGGGGASPNRGLASTSGPDLDSLFPGKPAAAESKSAATSMKISSEVQAAFDKNGITNRTIFEMVHSQYTKKSPMLFGVQLQKSAGGTTANPFTNLGNDNEKVEF